MSEEHYDRFASLGRQYAGYTVYDHSYEKTGKVEDLFINDRDELEYIGIHLGFLGMKSTLVPWEACRVNERRGLIEVAGSKQLVEEGPVFSEDAEITPDFERAVHDHYGLSYTEAHASRTGYGDYYASDQDVLDDRGPGPRERSPESREPGSEERPAGALRDPVYDPLVEPEPIVPVEEPEPHPRERAHESDERPRPPAADPPSEEERRAEREERLLEERLAEERLAEERLRGREHTGGTVGGRGAGESPEHPGISMGDTESGVFSEHPIEEEGVGERESDLEDEDELRVQRSEEELRAGTRERETGGVRVRKRVRTDHEQVRVPKRREEVSVDRVPVSGETPASEIGEDEIRIPVVEEEVVVEKRPVKKEEIRIRKEVVEEEELVEGDVRKEEVEVEDRSRHAGNEPGGRHESDRDDRRGIM